MKAELETTLRAFAIVTDFDTEYKVSVARYNGAPYRVYSIEQRRNEFEEWVSVAFGCHSNSDAFVKQIKPLGLSLAVECAIDSADYKVMCAEFGINAWAF